MTDVVITGASGFIGSALSIHLSQQGLNVIPVSRKYVENITHIESYYECPKGDVLIHLAESANRMEVNQLGETYKAEMNDITSYLSDLFGGNMIYASSAVVYGDTNLLPNTEDSTVVKSDLYSQNKLNNERTVLSNGGTVVRLANLYGLGMSKFNVLSDILNQLPGSGVIVVKNGSPIRDFLCLDDLLDAISLLVTKKYNDLFNIGSGEGVSVFSLCDIILSNANQSGREVMSKHSSTKDSVNVLDISKFQELTDWHPSGSLQDNLSKIINSGDKFKYG